MEARFKFECSCGQHLVARASMAGTKVHCPACRQELTIPQAGEALDDSAYKETERYAVVCSCGRQMLVKAEAAGKTVHCAHCGKAIKLPPIEQLRGKKTPTLETNALGREEITTRELLLLVDDEEGPGTDIR
jgi:DNA-directed RNA polymerase subunit M/transcription elongation factor TFIIS